MPFRKHGDPGDRRLCLTVLHLSPSLSFILGYTHTDKCRCKRRQSCHHDIQILSYCLTEFIAFLFCFSHFVYSEASEWLARSTNFKMTALTPLLSACPGLAHHPMPVLLLSEQLQSNMRWLPAFSLPVCNTEHGRSPIAEARGSDCVYVVSPDRQ